MCNIDQEASSVRKCTSLSLAIEEANFCLTFLKAITGLNPNKRMVMELSFMPYFALPAVEIRNHLKEQQKDFWSIVENEIFKQLPESLVLARRGAKLFDDKKRNFDQITEDFKNSAKRHKDYFDSGVKFKWAQRFQSDMGVFTNDGNFFSSTLLFEFYTGIPFKDVEDEEKTQTFLYLMGVYLSSMFKAVSVAGLMDTTSEVVLKVGETRSKDAHSQKWNKKQFGGHVGEGEALALGALLGSLSLLEMLLNIKERNLEKHFKGPIFRWQYLTSYHVIRGIKVILESKPELFGSNEKTVKAFLNENIIVSKMLTAPEAGSLRNRLTHYGFANADPQVIIREAKAGNPLSGLIEAIWPGETFTDLNLELDGLTTTLLEVFSQLRTMKK